MDQGPYSFGSFSGGYQSSYNLYYGQAQPYSPLPLCETVRQYAYYVRLVTDPKRKSKYIVRLWHGIKQVFTSCDELKQKLQDSFSDDLPQLTSDFSVGYFEPPNGAKRWIIDDRDLEGLYKDRESGLKINLWCEPKVPARDEEEPVHKKKGTSREVLEDEMDTIFKQLKEKNPKMENPKLRLWAKIIQTGRWDHYDNPPPIPLITATPKSQSRKDSITDALTGVATAVVNALKPQE